MKRAFVDKLNVISQLERTQIRNASLLADGFRRAAFYSSQHGSDPAGKKEATHGKKVIGSVILTIGHSTLELAKFIQVLQGHGVTLLADVRTVPRSRHNPQFDRETLPEVLRAAGIDYVHLPGLGGLRHARADSPNMAWRNASFRGFADYMQTDEFAANVERLIELARKKRVALMCAEAVPWRCHRSLIADALTARGVPVEHIMGAIHRQAHVTTPWAQVEGRIVTYPDDEAAPSATG